MWKQQYRGLLYALSSASHELQGMANDVFRFVLIGPVEFSVWPGAVSEKEKHLVLVPDIITPISNNEATDFNYPDIAFKVHPALYLD
jgi:hypothetical protein